MAQNVTYLGTNYASVPQVILPKTGGGSAIFTDVSDTTAVAQDVASGKTFYLANGQSATGTSAGASLTPYVLRPDATIVKQWTFDQMLIEDMKVQLPAYTTTATTFVSAADIETVTLEASYDYFVCVRSLTIPEYNIDTKSKGRQDYITGQYVYEIPILESGTFRSLDGTKSFNSRNTAVHGVGFDRYLYWSSATAVAMLTATTYGISQVSAAPTISSLSLTVKSPSIKIRGNGTYFPKTFWDAIDDVRIQYVIQLYKSPRSTLNIDAWCLRQQMVHVAEDCVTDPTHTLT